MICKNIEIKAKNLIDGMTSTATLSTYIPDNSEEIVANRKRKSIIICPGGGYYITSCREAEPVALQLTAQDYNVFILWYSVKTGPVTMPLVELAHAIKIIRENAEQWNVDVNQIIIGGFSAGGHLCANLSTLWHTNFIKKLTGLENEIIKPNGLFLGYPALVYDLEKNREGSLPDYIKKGEMDGEKFDFTNLRSQISEKMPPAFIWQTFPDNISVNGSLMFAQEMKNCDVPFELHVFPTGKHGLSLGTEISAHDESFCNKSVESWMGLLVRWLKYFM